MKYLINWFVGILMPHILQRLLTTPIKVHVLPGGQMPQRMTDGAIGYDSYLRAIVHPVDKDPCHPIFRKTVYDFDIDDPPDELRKKVGLDEDGSYYLLDPNESVLCGIGFTTEMPFPLFYWVAPRSGLASKEKITVTNAPGTVDPDYRGEAGVLVHNRSSKPYKLYHNMRICQVVFGWAVIPNFEACESHSDLSDTPRGIGGFGSTGLLDKKD